MERKRVGNFICKNCGWHFYRCYFYLVNDRYCFECPHCEKRLYQKDIYQPSGICDKCGHPMRYKLKKMKFRYGIAKYKCRKCGTIKEIMKIKWRGWKHG
jgi:predicted nucleic acid-binding Zn ribbon protein